MNEKQQPKRIEINQWPFRIQHPETPSVDNRVMLLLHGHMGNENAMWILTKPLPKEFYLLAPRAPIKTGQDQYSWHEITPQWPEVQTYQDLAEQLISRVDHWIEQQGIKTNRYDIMGFSQGAVMAYALTILFPERIGKVAALAGFIPQNWQEALDLSTVKGKIFFIAHGTQDDVIPIKKAHQASAVLEENGAQVTFCEAKIGHKLSANCFNGLGEFFS